MHQLQEQTISNAFHAVGLRPDVTPLGHVLNIDHFHMSQPTFPPHPYAGFSAVTWMLPWSAGAFINRDSRGDRSRIGPGDLHWTLAGSGMLHEEIPELPGTDCEGLQIFVKLPELRELVAPRAYHVAESDVPAVSSRDGHVRVLVGSVGAAVSVIPDCSATTLAHASVTGKLSVTVPSKVEAFAMVLRGSGRIANQSAAAHAACALPAGELLLEGDGLEVLIGWSPAMTRKPTFQGPFCMFETGKLADAGWRFRAGEMGSLAASPVAWQRPGA